MNGRQSGPGLGGFKLGIPWRAPSAATVASEPYTMVVIASPERDTELVYRVWKRALLTDHSCGRQTLATEDKGSSAEDGDDGGGEAKFPVGG